MGVDARVFGDLVHSVIEHARDFSAPVILAEMDRAAREALHSTNTENLMFRFWHKRFVEIAKLVQDNSELLKKSVPEITGHIVIDGVRVCARADRVWDGGVMDIKTGDMPTKSQLQDGMMPQLPLEAYMLKSGGFNVKMADPSKTPDMVFMYLKNSKENMYWIAPEDVAGIMDAAIKKTKEVIDMFAVGNAPYEYRKLNGPKYKDFDDLARVDD